MLRVPSGLQRGWFGRLRLPPAFLDRLAESRVGADATTSLPATNTLNLEDGRSL
jgi:hypothetical protein